MVPRINHPNLGRSIFVWINFSPSNDWIGEPSNNWIGIMGLKISENDLMFFLGFTIKKSLFGTVPSFDPSPSGDEKHGHNMTKYGNIIGFNEFS